MSTRPSSNKSAATSPAPQAQAPQSNMSLNTGVSGPPRPSAHVQAVHGQITAGGASQVFFQITGRVKFFQLGQRSFSRCDLDAPVGAEQSEPFQSPPRQAGALGF